MQPIDASSISLGDGKYIAASYPREKKLFWKMLFDEKSPVVVKLCQTSGHYWPLRRDFPLKFPDVDMKVVLLRTKYHRNDFTIRVFNVEVGEKTHKVTQLDFFNWPDFGIPNIENLNALVEKILLFKQSPITVHCMGGRGRTGTLISILRAIEEKEPNINAILKSLRKQRPYMVETAQQEEFISEFHLSRSDCNSDLLSSETSAASTASQPS